VTTGPASSRPPLHDVVTGDHRRHHYQAARWWDDATLAGQVALHAGRSPGAVAVVDGPDTHGVADLAADAAALASALQARGLGPSSVVSIQLPNWYESVVAAVAAQSMGAVINPLLPNYRAHELTTVFLAARPDAIVTPRTYRGFDHADLVAAVSRRTEVAPLHIVVRGQPTGSQVGWDALRGPHGGAVLEPGTADAVSELIFTSGTEARPKAVMHTEQTTNFSVRVAHRDLGVGDRDVVWMPSPVGHSTGFNYGTRFALYHGIPLVLQDRWDPDAALSLVTAQRCSYTLAAATFLEDLVGAAGRAGATVPDLRLFGCGGSPVPGSLVDAAGDVGVGVLRLYGSTEVLVGTWNRPWSPAEKRRDTDGPPMSHVEVVVRDDQGRDVAPGTAGELHVRGPNTAVGFFDDDARTAATFGADGWVRTGDLVTLDHHGYVTVVGRKKEILIRGGLNIAPREIEDLLVTFPEVERAAVVGLPDTRLGERMCACIVLAEGSPVLGLEDVVGRLVDMGVAVFKLPERLEIVPGLPTTASGKVQKHELVRQLAEPSGGGDG